MSAFSDESECYARREPKRHSTRTGQDENANWVRVLIPGGKGREEGERVSIGHSSHFYPVAVTGSMIIFKGLGVGHQRRGKKTGEGE